MIHRHESTPRRCARTLTGLILASLLVGCATVTTAPADTRLPGHWQRDAARSDDATARVAHAIADARAKLRARRGAQEGGPARGAGPGATGVTGAPPDEAPGSLIDEYGNTRLMGPDFAGLARELTQTLSAPDELTIGVDGESVRIVAGTLPARDYRLGEGFSRFDEYGTAVMKPAWSGNAFVLSARYTTGARRIERYEITPGEDTLTLRLQVVDPLVGKLELRSVYRRAPTS